MQTLLWLRPGLIGMNLAKRKVTELVVQGSRDRCRGPDGQISPVYEGSLDPEALGTDTTSSVFP